MFPTPRPRPRYFWLLLSCVCIAAAIVAGIMGIWASEMYQRVGAAQVADPTAFGLWWGAATGVLAGVIWCYVMILLAKPERHERLGRIGSLVGVAVGLLLAALLHAGLMLLTGQRELWTMGIGLAIAIPVGAVVGAICGGACGNAVADAGTDNAETLTVGAPQVAKPPRNPNDSIG